MKKILVGLFIFSLILVGRAMASVPMRINVQGILDPVPSNGTVIVFKIFDNPGGNGNALAQNKGTVGSGIIIDEKGYFSFDPDLPDDLAFDKPYYMEIIVGGQSLKTANGDLQPLLSVPYAITAKNVKGGKININQADAVAISVNDTNAPCIAAYGNNNYAITASSQNGVAIRGQSNNKHAFEAIAHGTKAAYWGRNSDLNGLGVFGWADIGIGVKGLGDPAVRGESNSNPKTLGTLGYHHTSIMGETKNGAFGQASKDNYGMLGLESGLANAGVYAFSTNDYGIYSYARSNYFSGTLEVGNAGDNAILKLNAANGKSAIIGVQDDNDQGFYVMTNNAYRLSVTQAGDVGIGTTAPNAKLHVAKGGGGTAVNAESTGAFSTGLRGKGDMWGVRSESDGWGMYSVAPKNYFSGNVGIGFTNPSQRLEVNGDVKVTGKFTESLRTDGGLYVKGMFQGFKAYNHSGKIAKLDSTGEIFIFQESSDRRLKTNIEPLRPGVLDKLLKIKGMKFVWKIDEQKKPEIGVIAQDVQKEFPEMVYTNDSNYLSIKRESFDALFIEALRELKAENEALKKRIAELEGK